VSQIVDKTIMEADQDHDGKISFEEFTKMVENTDVSMSMTLGGLFLLPRAPTRQSSARCTDGPLFHRSILAVLTAIPAGLVARRCVLNSLGTGYHGMEVTTEKKMRKQIKRRLHPPGVRRTSRPWGHMLSEAVIFSSCDSTRVRQEAHCPELHHPFYLQPPSRGYRLHREICPSHS